MCKENGNAAAVSLFRACGHPDPASGSARLSESVPVATVDVAAALLLAHPKAAAARDACGRSPLMWAAWNGAADIVTLLIKTYRVDVSAASTSGWTPLYVAARCGRANIAAQIIAAGASVDKADADGTTPLFAAAHMGARRGRLDDSRCGRVCR